MRSAWRCLLFLLCFVAARNMLGSGSGLNVIVVANQQSTNSVALAEYYAQMRQVPLRNIVYIQWSGGPAFWSLQQFTNSLLVPLHTAISNRGLTNQGLYVLLSMDIPYRIIEGSHVNSTTTALFYGFKTNDPAPGQGLPDSCSLPDASTSHFAGAETPFRDIAPGSLSWTNLLATMITASNLPTAKLTVTQGALSDSSFPDAPAVLSKSGDAARNVRYELFDTAVFDSRVQGVRLIQRTNSNGLEFGGQISGAQTGYYSYDPSAVVCEPGTLIDNLTSFGGLLFENNSGQITGLNLLAAGAAGSYGTVVEPCNYLEKFPIPEVFFYQSRGFALAETYYMGVTNPYQGIVLGDPLAAPFARPPTVYLTNIPAMPLSGSANLSLRATAADQAHPVARVDLFIDNVWTRTLTNIPPAQGNTISAFINGSTIGYTVPAAATASTIASGLASAINAKNPSPRASATATGDRIRLTWTNASVAGSQALVSVSTARGTAPALTTSATAARPAFLDSIAYGIRSFTVSGNPTNRWLALVVTKTNGEPVVVGVTNTSTPLGTFVQQLVNAINTHPSLSTTDGVIAEDVVAYTTQAQFNVRARAPGLPASQIIADASAATGLTFVPGNAAPLQDNLADLQPRNHLTFASGLPDLLLSFPLDTAQLSDGPHQLTIVATEGANTRAQRASTVSIEVKNTGVQAELATLLGGTNVALEATLSYQVRTTGGVITNVQIMGPAGALASSASPTATLSFPATLLGPGVYPIFGQATTSSGQKIRTPEVNVRVLNYEPGFTASASAMQTNLLTWTATAGRTYTVLATTNLAEPFLAVASVTPTNNLGTWAPFITRDQKYFRIRTQ